jgi:hypothetical protein
LSPTASIFPSGLYTACGLDTTVWGTEPSDVAMVARGRPARMPHSRTVASADPLASVAPSGLNASAFTNPV